MACNKTHWSINHLITSYSSFLHRPSDFAELLCTTSDLCNKTLPIYIVLFHHTLGISLVELPQAGCGEHALQQIARWDSIVRTSWTHAPLLWGVRGGGDMTPPTNKGSNYKRKCEIPMTICWEPGIQSNYVERSLSEATGCSPIKTIPRLQFESKFQYSVHNSIPVDHMSSPVISVYNFRAYNCKMHSIIIFPYTTRFFKLSLPFRLMIKILCAFSIRAISPAHVILLGFRTIIVFWI